MAAKPKFDYKQALATLSKNQEVAKLQLEVASQKAKLAAQGGQVPHTHPGVLSRILDVVSRPNYAVANTYKTVVDKINENKAAGKGGNITELPGLLARGAARGIEGKDKTRFADVFAAGSPHGNRVVRAVAGIGADLALDPLNYVGGSFTKAVHPIEEGGASLKAIQEGARVAGRAAKPADLIASGEKAALATRAAQPGKIGLEVLGRPVVESERAYNALAKIGRPIAESGPVSTAHNLLSTGATYPGRVKAMMRVPLQRNISAFHEVDKDILSEIGHLSKEEGTRVSRALQDGTDLSGVMSHSGKDLGQVQQYYINNKRNWDKIEADLGITRAGHGIDNYVPKKFASRAEYEGEKAKELRDLEWKAHKTLNPNVDLPKSVPNAYPDTKAFTDVGLHPHENITDIMRLRAAEHHRSVARAIFKRDALDQLGAEFKSYGRTAGAKAAEEAGFERVPKQLLRDTVYAGKDVHAPPEIIRAFKTLDHLYQNDEATNKLLQTFDSVQRLWKTGVTTVNPSHHIRNMVGDAFLNWEDGVNTPQAYQRGFRAVTNKPGEFKIGNLRVKAGDIMDTYHAHGGGSGFFNTELIGGSERGVVSEKLTRPLNSKMEWLRNKVAQREDIMRVTHYVHAMRDYADKHGVNTWADFEKASQHAIERVKKYNFDYGDLTHFESNVRRAVPFYTFMRNNLPLQLEMIALHPNKISRVPKGYAALQQLLGTDAQHLPISEVVPSYIRDIAALRVRGEGKGHNASYFDPQLPLEDIGRTFSGSAPEVVRKLLGQTGPLPRAAIEVGTKTSLMSGAKVQPGWKYALNQLPVTRNVGEQFDPSADNKALNWANWLTGVTPKPITVTAQKSELRRQQDPVQARLRAAKAARKPKPARKK